jgi:hypothetical protein
MKPTPEIPAMVYIDFYPEKTTRKGRNLILDLTNGSALGYSKKAPINSS